jgi:hypothetical protein
MLSALAIDFRIRHRRGLIIRGLHFEMPILILSVGHLLQVLGGCQKGCVRLGDP